MLYQKQFDNEFKPLQITEVKIWPHISDNDFVGFASVKLGNDFVLKNIKVFRNKRKAGQLFLVMPKRREGNGRSHALFEPTTEAALAQLTRTIRLTFEAWQNHR